MSVIEPRRGHVYRMHDQEYGTMHCLIVSIFPAYDLDDSCQAVRVTAATTPRSFPGWVRMNSGDPIGGYVITHDLDRVDPDELTEDLGAMSMETMVKVEQAIRHNLGL